MQVKRKACHLFQQPIGTSGLIWTFRTEKREIISSVCLLNSHVRANTFKFSANLLLKWQFHLPLIHILRWYKLVPATQKNEKLEIKNKSRTMETIHCLIWSHWCSFQSVGDQNIASTCQFCFVTSLCSEQDFGTSFFFYLQKMGCQYSIRLPDCALHKRAKVVQPVK